MITWDTDRLFELAGGVRGVLDICAKSDPLTIPPRPATVAVWKNRKRISAEWLPAVVEWVLASFDNLCPEQEALFTDAPATTSAPSDGTGLELSDVGL